MTQRTAPAPSPAEQDPADIETMRATIARALTPENPAEETREVLALLHGEIALMLPELEAGIARLPKNDGARYCALACVGEARMKLRASSAPVEDDARARSLARTLAALCDHHEGFTQVAS